MLTTLSGLHDKPELLVYTCFFVQRYFNFDQLLAFVPYSFCNHLLIMHYLQERMLGN